MEVVLNHVNKNAFYSLGGTFRTLAEIGNRQRFEDVKGTLTGTRKMLARVLAWEFVLVARCAELGGFSTGQFTRWFDVKYGTKEDRRMWLKLHLMCGVKTNIVTSVQVSDGYAHDYHYYKALVNRTAETGFNMKEVSADKAYLGAENTRSS
jgi:hypothetical protein